MTAPPLSARRAVRAPGAIAEVIPLGLVVIAEAAWISVLGGLLDGFTLREPSLGIPVLVLFVLGGVVAARVLGRRLGRWWPPVALLLVAGATAVGGLAAAETRGALGGGVGPAIAANPGGWIAGLAVLRGFAHARLPLDEGTVARLIGLGVPGIAAMAIVGGVMADPYRARFLADTLTAAVVFVGAGVLAVTLGRIRAIGQGGGFDWRRNPSWLLLAIAAMAISLAAAVPLSAVAGWAIEALLAIALLPMLVLGLAVGLDPAARRLLLAVAVAAVAIAVIASRFTGRTDPPILPEGQPSAPTQASAADQLMAVSFAGLGVLVAIVAVLLLAAVWMRRARPEADLVEETRVIDRGVDRGAGRHRTRRIRRRRPPASAPEAYVELMDDLARDPAVARGAAETPSEHAARLRTAGRSDLRLDLLAADYALARYGDVGLSASEHRKAVGRWRMLRKRLLRVSSAGRG